MLPSIGAFFIQAVLRRRREGSIKPILLNFDRAEVNQIWQEAQRVVAFAIKSSILAIRKSGSVQAMGGTKWPAQTEENGFVIPEFRKKIVTLMQSNAVQRQERIDTVIHVIGQTLSRHRAIFHSRHLFIQISMIELGAQ